MEVVIDYETLGGGTRRGRRQRIDHSLRQRPRDVPLSSPFHMEPQGEANGLNWSDGIIDYAKLFQTVSEATANFAHLYAKGSAKNEFLSSLPGRTVQNLNTFGCSSRKSFRTSTSCSLPCHQFPDKSCAARNAHSL